MKRHYVCHGAQQRGWQQCPSPSVPAGEIYRFVVDQIKCVGSDPNVIKETLAQARTQDQDQIERLRAERGGPVWLAARSCRAWVTRWESRSGDPRLVESHDRIRDAERRVNEIDSELATLDGDLVDEREVAAALADFDVVWDCLAPHEQSRVIELRVERVSDVSKDVVLCQLEAARRTVVKCCDAPCRRQLAIAGRSGGTLLER